MPQSLLGPGRTRPTMRTAETRDIEAIVHLGCTTFAASFGHSMPASDLQAYLETAYSTSSIANDLKNPLIDIILACDNNDNILGFAQLTQGTIEPCVAGVEAPIELQRLYVSRNHHGSGIGRALETEVEKIAHERGFRTMWLGVWEENLNAQRAYGRFGFVKVGSHDFVMGKCVQTDWIMVKSL